MTQLNATPLSNHSPTTLTISQMQPVTKCILVIDHHSLPPNLHLQATINVNFWKPSTPSQLWLLPARVQLQPAANPQWYYGSTVCSHSRLSVTNQLSSTACSPPWWTISRHYQQLAQICHLHVHPRVGRVTFYNCLSKCTPSPHPSLLDLVPLGVLNHTGLNVPNCPFKLTQLDCIKAYSD